MRKLLFVFLSVVLLFILLTGCTNKNEEAAERIDKIGEKTSELYKENQTDIADFSDEDSKEIESLIDEETANKADLNEDNTAYLNEVEEDYEQAKVLQTLDDKVAGLFEDDVLKEQSTKKDITSLKKDVELYKKQYTEFYDENKSQLNEAEDQEEKRTKANQAVADLFEDEEVIEEANRESEEEANELANKVKNEDVKDSFKDSLAQVDQYLTEKEDKKKQEEQEKSAQKQQQAKENKYIALTFDDGPASGSTEKVLDALQQYNADATFFMLGEKVNENPDLAKRVADEGHEIANHSITHPDLATLDEQQVRNEMQDSQEQIEEATGVRPDLFRPPYGSRTDIVDSVANETEQQLVFWDIDTMDWENQNSQEMEQIVEEQIHPGSVILMHDIHETSADAVPAILATLQSQGYEFVKVSDVI